MPKPVINLLRGWPAPSLLPADLILSAAATTLTNPAITADALLYGPELGYEPLRSSIATWLTDFYRPATAVPSSRICITGGASQNLGCMLSVYTDPVYTQHVWIVAPAYFLAFRVFEDAGFAGRMRAVPEMEEGPDLEFLAREMGKSTPRPLNGAEEGRPQFKPDRARAKVYKHVIYCVPTFANPSSRTMNLRVRKELVTLARRFDALVVCDDVYDFLQWPIEDAKMDSGTQTAHLPRLVDIDRELDGGPDRPGADGFGNVCSNGSFSKIAGPGIRVGWAEGTEKFAYGVSQTGTTTSGGAPSQLTSTYVHHLLASNALQTHIQHTLIPAYATRSRALISAVTTTLLPLGFALPQPSRNIAGGFFTWLQLPEGLDADTFTNRCYGKESLVVASGTLFKVPGDIVEFRGFVRLCWAWEEVDALQEAVERMERVAKFMLEERKQRLEEGEEYVVVEGSEAERMALDEYK